MGYSPWGHKESNTTERQHSTVNLLPGGSSETQERWVRSLGGEEPLEEGKAMHSSVLAWRSL